jgi:hypothetical protein
MKIQDFLIFGLIWHLEGFGSMENTPTGCGSDLPTILRILKNDSKSRSVNIFLQPLDLDPDRIKDFDMLEIEKCPQFFKSSCVASWEAMNHPNCLPRDKAVFH